MWNYQTYCWPTEEDYLAALDILGWKEGAPPEIVLLPNGTLYGSNPNEDGSYDALPGWYVAAAFRGVTPPSDWSALEVDPPEGMPVIGKTPAPSSVSRFQARAALAMAGKLEEVDVAIANSGNVIAQLAWSDAQVFERNSPTIAALAASLGLTEAQIDDLFRQAAKIVA